jgi:hypothetical protein
MFKPFSTPPRVLLCTALACATGTLSGCEKGDSSRTDTPLVEPAQPSVGPTFTPAPGAAPAPPPAGDDSTPPSDEADLPVATAGPTMQASPDGGGGEFLEPGIVDAGAAVYERLDCDLPAAITFCGGGTCHYDNSEALGSSLALVNRETQQMLPGVESRLVNQPASYHNVLNPEACPSEPELLVDPSDPERSLVLTKLMGTHSCGDEMPKFPYPEWGATNNPGDQREDFVSCIQAWVTLLTEDYNQTP